MGMRGPPGYPDVTCLTCGDSFHRAHREQKYCKQACGHAAQRTGRTLHERTCLHCGASFLSKNPKGKYCKLRCSGKASRVTDAAREAAAGRRRPSCVCGFCGKSFHPKASDRKKFCTRAHAFAHKKERAEVRRANARAARVAPMECKACGGSFVPLHSQSHVCKASCQKQLNRERQRRIDAARKPLLARLCGECGHTFVPEYGNKRRRFCSDRCLHSATKKTDAARNAKREANRRRRARKAGAYVERVSFKRVCERDHWRCGICGRAVDPNLMFPHPMSKSLDHIVPLALGGGHAYSNAQLAHFMCNSRKSASLPPSVPRGPALSRKWHSGSVPRGPALSRKWHSGSGRQSRERVRAFANKVR